MRKKGQFSETMTFAPVLLLIVFLMALFLLASFWASNSRVGGNKDASFGNYISENSILFKSINVYGNNILVAEEMINSYNQRYKFTSDKFESEIKKILLSDKSYSGKNACLYLTIGKFQDFRKLMGYYTLNYDDLYIHKSADGKIIVLDDLTKTTFKIQDEIIANLNDNKIVVKDNEISIISYYGGCANE